MASGVRQGAWAVSRNFEWFFASGQRSKLMSYSLRNRRVREAGTIPRIQPRRGFSVLQDERSLLGQFGRTCSWGSSSDSVVR